MLVTGLDGTQFSFGGFMGLHRVRPLAPRTRKRITAVAVAGAAAVGFCGFAIPSASAFAPTLVITGGAGCHALDYLPSSLTLTLENGVSGTSGFSLRSYRVAFYGIAVGKQGVAATATVTCSDGPAHHYTWSKTLTIPGPKIGNHDSINLGSG
jgi:hypothetical protein